MTVKINGANTVANPAFTGADTDTGLQCGTNELKLVTGGSTRATVDSSGHLGLGTTSPAAKLEIGGIPSSGQTEAFTIDRVDGTQLFSIDYNVTGQEVSFSGNNKKFVVKNKASSAESLRIDESGRLFVGTTSELISGAEKKLQMTHDNAGAEIVLGRNDSSVGSGNSLGAVKFVGNDGGTYHQCAQIEAIADGSHSNSAKPTRLQFNVTSGSAVTPSERLRIESEGRSMFFAEQAVTYISSAAGAGTSHALITGVHSNSTVSLRVWTNGNISNTNNSYGSLSDSKLKENIVDANSQWDDIKDIRVRNYNFIEGQTHTQLGVVAQEVETVSPGLVYETSDVDDEGNDLGTVTKSVNYSVLYMKAVKALQEAQTRIETLETQYADLLARVTALEATE